MKHYPSSGASVFRSLKQLNNMQIRKWKTSRKDTGSITGDSFICPEIFSFMSKLQFIKDENKNVA
jgi:hypothetical protein